MSVVIAEHSSVYTYPESHQFIRAAANSPYMRTVRKERRQRPQVYWMNLDYALLTQPDMFHLIDNVGGNINDTGNMMIMKFHLQSKGILDTADPISYSAILSTDKWSATSQKKFLRNNLKYLHDPRSLVAYSRTEDGQEEKHDVYRSDVDGSLTECVAKIKQGLWTMPFGGETIDSSNVDNFLLEISRVDSSNKKNQLKLEEESRGTSEPIDLWENVMDYERRLDAKELELDAANPEPSQDA